jgi:hypothetical protein
MTIGIVSERPGGMQIRLEPKRLCLATMNCLVIARTVPMAEVSDPEANIPAGYILSYPHRSGAMCKVAAGVIAVLYRY